MDEDKSAFYWVVGIIIAIIAGVIFFSISKDNSPPVETTPKPPVITTDGTKNKPDDTNSSGCFTPKNVRDHIGENGCVDFHVGYVYESSKGNKFIDEFQNYSSGFAVYIPNDSAASSVDLDQFLNEDIPVTGQISIYQGGPQVIVRNLSQIKIYQ